MSSKVLVLGGYGTTGTTLSELLLELLPVSAKELRARVEYGRHVVELPWGESSIDDEADVWQTRLTFRLQMT